MCRPNIANVSIVSNSGIGRLDEQNQQDRGDAGRGNKIKQQGEQ